MSKDIRSLGEAARYSTAFKSSTALAAGTNEQVLAAASNVNGVVVWSAGISTAQNTGATGVSHITLQAHTAAPATPTDGDPILHAICFLSTAAGAVQANTAREQPIFIPPGKGLWFRNSGNPEAGAMRSVLYTVL